MTDSAYISGSASSSLNIWATSQPEAADFTVVISNAYGSVTSAVATLTVGGIDSVIPAAGPALVDLYKSTKGANWSHATNWVEPFKTNWSGVYVSQGHVVVLDLRAKNLRGSLPDSLGNLSSLQAIYLGSNQIIGSLPASSAG